jgi:cytochrome c
MNAVLFLAEVPIPRDLPLPLPLAEGTLKVLIVLTFLVHILFVNLMVGGSFVVVALEWLGLRQPRFDALAHQVAETVTVNKSLAVVMGIGPLLCINLVYTMQWYSANSLTGHAWLLIIPLVISAFLLTYLHKYTWERWSHGPAKRWHLALGALAAAHFLFIPLIFLANINLMLYPGEWEKVRGFLSSLVIGNVAPRYAHFLLASIALTGLFLVHWLGRRTPKLDEAPGFTHAELRRVFYRVAFLATAAQFLVGPTVLLTLPSVGLSAQLYKVIFLGIGIALLVMLLLWRELRATDERIGRWYVPICVLFSAVVLSMGSGRHLFRETALADHQAKIHTRTAEFQKALTAFNESLAANGGVQETGETLFANCAACHARDKVLVGPPLTEIAQIYRDNPDGIVTWAKAPGKKRPALPQMPPMAHLGEANLRKVAAYMLELGGSAAAP